MKVRVNFNGIECTVESGLAVWLTIAMILAKLTDVISWSWWIVFTPILATIAIAIIGVVVITVWEWFH